MKKETGTVSKIIADSFSEKASKISPLFGKGSVNQVFLVETVKTKYIVRMNHSNSLDEFEKEIWATNKAFEKQIPVSKILKIGVFDSRAFSIQEYIKGIEGKDLLADKKFVWKKLGEYARRIHSIQIGGFGLDLGNMKKGNSQKSWLKYLDYNIESLDENDKLLTLNVLTKAQSKIVRSILKELKLRKFNFGLNHGDLSLKNTIIDEFETVHLIDWGSAEASIVPHHDLIELLKENMQENDPTESEIEVFLEGYGISKNEFQQLLPDLESLLLLRSFDKLRWAIDWKTDELKNYVQHAKEAVDRLLN